MGYNSLTTGWNVLKFLDMVDMELKLCKRVSKCLALRLAHVLLNFVETIFLKTFLDFFFNFNAEHSPTLITRNY